LGNDDGSVATWLKPWNSRSNPAHQPAAAAEAVVEHALTIQNSMHPNQNPITGKEPLGDSFSPYDALVQFCHAFNFRDLQLLARNLLPVPGILHSFLDLCRRLRHAVRFALLRTEPGLPKP